jgi:4-hydroxybenzoyl-CoA thioesterase
MLGSRPGGVEEKMEQFVAERILRFSDCDPSGIAYFPSYLNLLNGVVEDFWSFLGVPLTQLITTRRIGTPTVQLECQFMRPALFGEHLTFLLHVTKIGRSSLHFAHRINGADGLKWSARQVVVATSLREHRAISWPDDVRESLRRHISVPTTAEPA